MRVNVYAEELTGQVELTPVIAKTGQKYIGLRFVLESAAALHDTPDDDDRSAVTLWFSAPSQARYLLGQAQDALDNL